MTAHDLADPTDLAAAGALSDRSRDGAGAGGATCIVRVCRDCCCGTERKHPGVDHDALLGRLERSTVGQARVLRSACLLACDESDVVVVTPSPAGRRAGGRPVWLGAVLDDAVVDAVAEWVRAGGPGLASVPGSLSSHAFAPSRLAVDHAPSDAAGSR